MQQRTNQNSQWGHPRLLIDTQGKAIIWLLTYMHLASPKFLPVYLTLFRAHLGEICS